MYHPKIQKGFTLLELLVTIVVMAILINIAVPSFSDVIKSNRTTTLINRLVMDINLSRSEAVKRGEQVILCRSANPAASPPSCGGSSNIWTTGWIMFLSRDANTSYDDGTDILLKQTEITSVGNTIITNSEADAVLIFNSDGTKSGSSSVALFAICDDRNNDGNYDEEYGTLVKVINTGRPGLEKGTTASPISSCNAPT